MEFFEVQFSIMVEVAAVEDEFQLLLREVGQSPAGRDCIRERLY